MLYTGLNKEQFSGLFREGNNYLSTEALALLYSHLNRLSNLAQKDICIDVADICMNWGEVTEEVVRVNNNIPDNQETLDFLVARTLVAGRTSQGKIIYLKRGEI